MQILYFGWVRSRIGVNGEDMSRPDGVETVADLMSWLKARGDGYTHAFQDMEAVRAAVNQEITTPEARITEADEIAFFPPMTGG